MAVRVEVAGADLDPRRVHARAAGASTSGGGAGSVTPSSSSASRRAHAVARSGGTSSPWTVVCRPIPSSTATSRAAVSCGISALPAALAHAVGEHLGQHRAPADVEAPERVAHQRRVHGLAPGVDPQPPRRHVRPLGLVEVGGEPLGRVLEPARDRLQRRQILARGGRERLGDDLVLGAEVVVQQPQRGARLARDRRRPSRPRSRRGRSRGAPRPTSSSRRLMVPAPAGSSPAGARDTGSPDAGSSAVPSLGTSQRISAPLASRTRTSWWKPM